MLTHCYLLWSQVPKTTARFLSAVNLGCRIVQEDLSLTHSVNGIGPRTAPCGAPTFIGSREDFDIIILSAIFKLTGRSFNVYPSES